MPPSRDPATPDAVAAIEAAFPPDGGTFPGTRVLLDPEGTGPAPLQPIPWREMAERINEIDHSEIHSLEPDDFRCYLPGLLIGCLLHLPDIAPPYEDSILYDLIWGNDDRYWNSRFLDRWGHLTAPQLDAVERAVDLLLPDPPPEYRDRLYAILGPTHRTRARETLDLLRLRLALADP